jgi:hypothetical protein
VARNPHGHVVDPVFERVATDLALYALSTRGDAAATDYWAGYRPGPQAPMGPSMSLETAWQDDGGVYLFCAHTCADPPAFLAALDNWLAVHAPDRGVRYLWIDEPDRPQVWKPADLRARKVGAGSSTQWQVTRECRFVLSGYSLVIPAEALLVQRYGGAAGFWLYTGQLVLSAPQGANFASGLGSARLLLIGPSLGAWEADLALGAAGNPSPARLATQLRYAIVEPEATTGPRTVAMPLLREDDSSLVGDLSFDPLHPALPARTAIRLQSTTGSNPPPLDSYLRTPLGHPVTLTPMPESTWPARLVFNTSPGSDGVEHYLTADGAFVPGTPAADPRFAFGLSGLEYVDLPSVSAICRFVAGQPAFADANGALTDAATTAHIAVFADGPAEPGFVYFAQPELAPWFATGAGFLPSQPVPAATLPGSPGSALPVGCFGGISAVDTADAARLERAVLAPARRSRIAGDPPPGPAIQCVTPQGFRATVAAGGAGWDELVVASFPDAQIKVLAFTEVSPGLRGRLQATDVFMVITDPRALYEHASVRYRVDPLVLRQLEAADVPHDVIDRIAQRVVPTYPVFNTERELRALIEDAAGTYMDLVLSFAGLFKLTMDGWTFQLSPHSWRTDGESPTMLLIKLGAGSIDELVTEPAAWTTLGSAGDLLATQTRLGAIVAAAAGASPDSPQGRFFRTVLSDPRWSGLLFFNAPIAAAELPEQMRFVTAGIDPERFCAQHVALGQTPLIVTSGQVRLGRTPASALIQYVDETELAPTTTVSFDFVTQRLEVEFVGGALTGLSTTVQLIINQLFGSRLTRLDPVGGNSLTITGSYQRQDDVPGYRFGLDRRAVYQTETAVLDTIEVLGVAVRTRRAPDDASTVVVEFGLEGNLRFAQLGDFDLFSYGPQDVVPEVGQPEDGYLRFADLVVTMAFPVADPLDQTFTADEGRLRVDLANSRARRGSLAAGFPVTVTGVVAVPAGDVRPRDLGYAPVLAPLDQVPLTAPWYGLAMRLDLGTLGALGDAAGLTATLLAGWMPGTPDHSDLVYCGLKLPGLDDSGWPVQGVLRLGFRGYEFVVDRSGETPAFLLVMQGLALSVLGWRFPPRRADLVVFGDPEQSRATSLGWYGAYPLED